LGAGVDPVRRKWPSGWIRKPLSQSGLRLGKIDFPRIASALMSAMGKGCGWPAYRDVVRGLDGLLWRDKRVSPGDRYTRRNARMLRGVS